MSDFKARMHPIRFRLWAPPQAPLRNLQRSSDPLAGFLGSYQATNKGRKRRERKESGREGKGKEGNDKGKEGEEEEGRWWKQREGRGGKGPQGKILANGLYRAYTSQPMLFENTKRA